MMWRQRKFLPLLGGLGAAVILSRWMGFPISMYTSFNTPEALLQIVPQCMPTFIGGFVAALLAKRRGWQNGVIIAVLLEAFYVMAVIAAIMQAKATEWTVTAYLLQLHPWGLFTFRLVAGAGGGHLGQLLAHKWHKRKRRQSSATNIED